NRPDSWPLRALTVPPRRSPPRNRKVFNARESAPRPATKPIEPPKIQLVVDVNPHDAATGLRRQTDIDREVFPLACRSLDLDMPRYSAFRQDDVVSSCINFRLENLYV